MNLLSSQSFKYVELRFFVLTHTKVKKFIKSTWSQKRRVQEVGSVCGPDDEHVTSFVKPIQLS